MTFKPTQLPSGRWRCGFYHPVTRKKIQQTFDYAYEAEAWAVVAEDRARKAAAGITSDAVENRQPVAPRWVGPTVGEFGAQWLARRSGHVARATRAKYGAHLRGLATPVHPTRPAPAAVPMGLLSKPDVEQWLTDAVAAGVGRPTINGRLRLLRTLYGALFDADDAPTLRDPTRGIEFLTEDQDPDHVLSRDEEAALLAAASDQLAAAALVALDAGLRWQEVHALRASAVSGSYLVVSHVIERGSGDLRAFTKGKRTRVVPMTDRLAAVLEPVVKAAQRRDGRDALLFPATGTPDRVRRDRREALEAGRIPWDYGNHRKREWLPAMLAAGFAKVGHVEVARGSRTVRQRRIVDPVFGFHALRHTYGSRLAAAGVPRREIAELMGHADERITGRYIHAGDDGRRLALVREALGAA